MDQFINLTCPSCGARLKIVPRAAVCTCEYCGNSQVLNPAIFAPATPATMDSTRPPVPLPTGVTVKKQEHGLTIVHRWFSPKYIFMAFFCAFWDGFLLFWYAMAFAAGGNPMMICFPVVHVAVGLAVTYSTLAGFLNHTTVRVTEQEFIVQYDPLPWYGEIKVPAPDLAQIYCRRASEGSSKNAPTYALCAVLKNGKRIDLIKNLDSPDIGFFIEQQVEKWLHISDRPVGGELPR